MVDCPHLTHSVCIAGLDLEQLKSFGSGRLESKRTRSLPNGFAVSKNHQMKRKHDHQLADEDGNWNCVQCGTSQSPWLCLSCGLIHCGRYVNQDGLKHYKTYPNHSVSMDCYDYSVFCYHCDDYVARDTDDRKIASVRSSLQFYNCSRSEDHSYSWTKYESVPEPEEVIEISADDSPPHFYDETLEEEFKGTASARFKNVNGLYETELDSLEVQVTAEPDADEDPENCDYAIERSSQASLNLDSNCSEGSEKKLSAPAYDHNFVEQSPHSLEESMRPLLPTSASNGVPPPLQDRCFNTGHRTLRNRRRKKSGGSASDESVRSFSASASAVSSASVPSTSKQMAVGDGKKLRGLKNLTNTCFMNAVVQALNSVEIFRYFMSRLPPLEMEVSLDDGVPARVPRYNTRSSLPSSGIKSFPHAFITEELRKTTVELASGIDSSGAVLNAFSPEPFLSEVCKHTTRFRGFQQHDAHEFLRCVLDRMHVELKNCRLPDWLLSEVCEGGVRLGKGSHFVKSRGKKRKWKSDEACPISAMFEGALESHVTCLSCCTVSHKQDPFLDLSLDIYVPKSGCRAGTARLEECLRRFFTKEQLGNLELYACDRCQEKCSSTKQLFLRTLPNVLCLHLKRFRWCPSHRGKLDNLVDFPLYALDMKNYMIYGSVSTEGSDESKSLDSDSRSNSFSSCSSVTAANYEGSTVYDLTALIVHHGSGVSSGHYTAFGRHDGKWYHFNDSTVKPCTEQSVAKQKAYVLFYVRRNDM